MNHDDPNKPSTTPTENPAESVAQAWETTKEKAGEALQTGERYVRENPASSLLSVFGLGFLLGLLVGWSVARQENDDCAAPRAQILQALWR